MNNTVLVIDLFDSKERGQALGVFNGVEFIGSFIGAPIGAFVVGIVGNYTGVFYVTFLLVLISFASTIASKSFKEVKSRQAEGTNVSVRRNLENLREGGVMIFCICNFMNSLIMAGIFATVLALYLNKELFFSLEYIGIFLSIRTAGHIIATMSSGVLSERFSRRLIVIFGFLLAAGCLLIFIVVFSLEMFLAVGFIEGFGEGFINTGLVVLLSDSIHSSARGGAIGLYRTFMDVGGFIGPVAFMFIYTVSGSRSAFLAAFTIDMLSIILLVSWLYRKKQPNSSLP
ncbi:MAG: MFS transporter, partial [Candidatus Bathyarchaeota archaeon]